MKFILSYNYAIMQNFWRHEIKWCGWAIAMNALMWMRYHRVGSQETICSPPCSAQWRCGGVARVARLAPFSHHKSLLSIGAWFLFYLFYYYIFFYASVFIFAGERTWLTTAWTSTGLPTEGKETITLASCVSPSTLIVPQLWWVSKHNVMRNNYTKL